MVLALNGVAAALSAQSRGTLQISTQVLEVGPSQQALAAGMALLGSTPGPTDGSLAVIQLSQTASEAAEPSRLARPARAVITLSFLRN
jgi:hypothetical protein